MPTLTHSRLVLAGLFIGVAAGCGAGGGGSPEAAAPPQASAEAKVDGGGSSSASPTTWKRSQLGAHTVHVKIGDREELPVRSMQANVTVDGFLARVVLDLVVKNDRGGTYEGTFQLRLPEGASPYFFAFGASVLAVAGDAPPPFFTPDKTRAMSPDPAAIMSDRAALWSGPKEARMVPRERAAFAYGETVRRAVDPALLEWSGPGIFNARVYPLTQGSHRIVVGYDVPLVRAGADLEYAFDLPKGVTSKVVDVAVSAPQGAAIEATPKATASQAGARSFYRFEDPTGEAITLRVKKPAAAHVVADLPSKEAYFAADITPQLATTAPPKGSEAAVFMVDTSLSSNPDRINIWLDLMQAILRNNRDGIKLFNVLFFNVEASFWKQGFVKNDDASIAELVAFANTLALEGATDLGAALRRASAAPGLGAQGAPASADLFLLSDGSSTWGEPDARIVARSIPQGTAVFAYQTGLAGTDVEALSLLARESGGAVFSVTSADAVKTASVAHRARPSRILGVEVAGATDVLVAGRPQFVFPGQSLRVVGRGKPDKNASIDLSLAGADGKTHAMRIPLGQALASPLAARAYGQIAVAQMEELLPTAEQTASAYARRFRVPGKTSSLLMLESEQDYRRFDIVPENDAGVVGQSPVSGVVRDATARVASMLGDPKMAFRRWLDDLPRTAGVRFDFPPTLAAALDRMPPASFRVEAPPLAVTRRDRASIPEPVLASLKAHNLDYDAISAEGERRRAALGAADGLKALSSLVEESPGDAVLARDVGMSAMTWGLPADAFHLFRRVASSRPYEPQTYRAIAQSLARSGNADLAIAYFEIGLAGAWHQRFGEFRKIVAVEYAELLRRIENGQARTSVPEYAHERLAAVGSETRLGRADLVVMITWNTDGTDVDLHVVEPSGEECFYSHRSTQSGGQLTQDVTQGYGPEMYVLPSAPAGRYAIRAHYYRADGNRVSTRTKVHALVIEGYGTSRQKATEKIVVLAHGKQMHDLLDVVRGPSAQIAAP